MLLSDGGCGVGGCGAVNAVTVSTSATTTAATSLADVTIPAGFENGVIPTPEAAAAFVNASVANSTGTVLRVQPMILVKRRVRAKTAVAPSMLRRR